MIDQEEKYQKQTLSDVYYNLNKFDIKAEITDEEYDSYIDFGLNIGIIINDIISSFFNQRNIEIFKWRMNFNDMDDTSLETIGREYGISCERVQHIIDKIQKMIYISQDKYKLVEIFNSISDRRDLLNYLLYGIYNLYNYNFLLFLFQILDYKESSKIIDEINKAVKRNGPKQKNIADKIIKEINYGDYINPNATYIFNGLKKERTLNVQNTNGVQSIERFDSTVEYESTLEKSMIRRLENCKFVKDIKVQSLKIEYTYNGKPRSYYPDFQILTQDNKLVVMEIKDLFHMMDKHVMIKYKALEKYCIMRGFGYLMIDNENNTYEKLKNTTIDKNIEAQFINLIKLKKQINYGDCKLFMTGHEINGTEIVSIVINNCQTIECTFKPFQIKLK